MTLLFTCVALCAQRAEAGFVTVEAEWESATFEKFYPVGSMTPASSDREDTPASILEEELLDLDQSPQALHQSSSNGASSSAGSSTGPSTGASVAMLPLEFRLIPTLVTPLEERDLAFSPQCVFSSLFRPPCV